jgi:hypothetical protein
MWWNLEAYYLKANILNAYFEEFAVGVIIKVSNRYGGRPRYSVM